MFELLTLLSIALAAMPSFPMTISNTDTINAALAAVPCSVSKPVQNSYSVVQAYFGGNIIANTPSVDLNIRLASPDREGCAPLDFTCPEGCIVLAKRGTCSFIEKAQCLQPNITNVTVMLVYDNVPSTTLSQMSGENSRPSLLPGVAAFFMAFEGGDAIANALNMNISVVARMNATSALAPAEWDALRSIATSMLVAPCNSLAPGLCVDCSPAACLWGDARPWTDLQNANDMLDPCVYRVAGTQCRHGHVVSLIFPFPLMGTLPKAIGDLPFLEYLQFARGGVNEIGCVLQNLTRLRMFDISNNRLRDFPGCSLTSSIEQLYLTSNNLTNLPTAIANATSLKYLDLTANKLQSLPSQIGLLPSLLTLILDQNALLELPSAIANLPRLSTLNALSNGFYTVPSEILGMSTLRTLTLDGNRLDNLTFPSVPANLTTLSVSSNRLTKIPVLLEQMTSIKQISLARNRISGAAPRFDNFSSLTFLNLNDNFFTGSVPTLNSSGLLAQLWLHNNRFSGPLPESWKVLRSLTELRLQRNRITTPVHVMRKMTQLTFVDLSYNNLSLPSGLEYASPTDGGSLVFGSLPFSIQYVNMAYNNIEGEIDSTWAGILRLLQTVNVSHNRIRKSEGLHSRLTKLMVYDLSYNNLTVVDETAPTSPDVRLIAYNGNPNLTMASSRLPSWLMVQQPAVLYPSLSLLCLSVNTVPGVTLSNFQIILDPAFTRSQFCECIPGTFGRPPNCQIIPDYFEVNGTVSDELFGIHRQVAGVNIVFGPPSLPSPSSASTVLVELIIGPDFTAATDLLEVFEGDSSLKGLRLLTVRGTDELSDAFLLQAVEAGQGHFTLIKQPARNVSGEIWTVLSLEIYVSYAVVRFQSRKEAGQHFNATFSYSPTCPEGMVKSSNPETTCVHPSQEFVVSAVTQGILYFLVAFGALCILITMAIFTKMRSSKVVRAASFLFSMLTLSSLLIFLFGSLLYASSPKESYECHLRPWLTFLPLVSLLSFFLTKINRVRTIFNATKLISDRRHLKAYRLLQSSGILSGLMAVWLVVLSAVPLTEIAVTHDHASIGNGAFDLVRSECVSAGEPLFSVWCTVTAFYIISILVWGIYNAWQIRNTPSAFNESSLILASLLGVLILAGLCALFLLVLPFNANLVVVVWGLGQAILALYLFGVLFGRKLWALSRKEVAENRGSSSTSSSQIGNHSAMKLPTSYSGEFSSPDLQGPPKSELEIVTERLDAAEKALKFQRQLYEKIFREWGWTGDLP